jgi:hypothetical protein
MRLVFRALVPEKQASMCMHACEHASTRDRAHHSTHSTHNTPQACTCTQCTQPACRKLRGSKLLAEFVTPGKSGLSQPSWTPLDVNQAAGADGFAGHARLATRAAVEIALLICLHRQRRQSPHSLCEGTLWEYCNKPGQAETFPVRGKGLPASRREIGGEMPQLEPLSRAFGRGFACL